MYERFEMYCSCFENEIKGTANQTTIPLARLCGSKIWQAISVRCEMFIDNTRPVHSVADILGTIRSAKFPLDIPSRTNEWIHFEKIFNQTGSDASAESIDCRLLHSPVQFCYLSGIEEDRHQITIAENDTWHDIN